MQNYQTDTREIRLLERTLRVLVFPSSAGQWEMVLSALHGTHIYDVTTVGSEEEARRRLREGGYNACVHDPASVNPSSRYRLIDEFGGTCSMVVVTVSSSAHIGAECVLRGAKAVLDHDSLSVDDVRRTLDKWAVVNLLLPQYVDRDPSAVCRAISVLLANRPETVEDWARMLYLTTSSLRKMWRKRGVAAKHVQRMSAMYSRALGRAAPARTPVAGSVRSCRIQEYYSIRRSEFLRLIDRVPSVGVTSA